MKHKTGQSISWMVNFIDLVYNFNQFMKNQEFQIKLLIKQNTQMAIKLQNYRRENQELSKKNQNLNCWVQNLSEVFAGISAAWKAITDNQEAFYTLMRKKADPNSKAIINKYISHFKAFDEIVNNLGEKITNEGHSEAATIDAKARLTAFVSNYNLFFMEFVQAYFKFNDEYLAFINEKTEGQNLQPLIMQIKTKELENRIKIKEFQSYFGQFRENLKTYQNFNQHKLLDGIILEKNKEIQALKDQNLKKSRKIAYMVDYNTQNVGNIIEDQSLFDCSCGGAQLQYFKKAWQESLKHPQSANSNPNQQSQAMIDQNDQRLTKNLGDVQQINLQKQLLLQRNVQCLSKLEKLKLQNRLTEEAVLQSPVFISLKQQFNDLLDYTNTLIGKLNKNYEYLNELERVRLQEIEQLKKKYEKPTSNSKVQPPEPVINVDHRLLINFKDSVLKEMTIISNFYQSLCKDSKEREEKLSQAKQLMRALKKENEDMNRRLNDLQQRASKSVDHLEYRHSKFNELQAKVVEMFKSQPSSEDGERLRKLWDEYVEYVKTRDKKIKAMEDQIRKKDKEIAQKGKLEEVLKIALSETETIYVKSKERLDNFQQFMNKIEKEILNFSEENYKLKIESQQQKHFLNIRLKSETEVKAKLEERVKILEKIEAEMKLLKEKEIQIDRKFQEFNQAEKDTLNRLKLQLKEKEREVSQLNEILQEKDKNIEKIIQDKEKKNLEINKLKSKLKAIEEKTEYEVLLMEMEGYKNKIMCRCGAQRERQVVLMTCPHIFCKKCIEDSVGNRNRKCPICGIKFTKTDVHEICWT